MPVNYYERGKGALTLGSARKKNDERWFDDDESDSPNSALLYEIDTLVDRSRAQVQRWTQLPDDLREKFEISWIYHDCALEGSVLAFHELKAAIDKKVLSDVSLMPTYQEIKNHKAAIDLLREFAESKKKTPITINTMRNVHGLLCHATPDEKDAGKYRREIPVNKLYFHDIEAPDKIAYEMRKLGEWMVSNEAKRTHVIRYAAAVHHRVLQIFPFSQHAGKVARLTMNAILVQAGYWPVVIHSIDRQRYYETLRGTTRMITAFVGDALRYSLLNTLKHVGGRSLTKDDYRASVG